MYLCINVYLSIYLSVYLYIYIYVWSLRLCVDSAANILIKCCVTNSAQWLPVVAGQTLPCTSVVIS